MSMDSNGNIHGNNGRFQRKPARSEADDLKAQDIKTQVEQLAAAGRNQEAISLARQVGAFTPGEQLPFGDGSIALFDGRELVTCDIHGPEITARDEFDPETIRIPDGL